jgi:hypothetical protein
MYHSRLTFHANRESRQPPSSRTTTPSPSTPLANERTPFEFELYEHAYFMTREYSGTPPGPPGLRAR